MSVSEGWKGENLAAWRLKRSGREEKAMSDEQ
jgi:hypothetical protein